MADDIIPAWGVPWHGLIKGGVLNVDSGPQIPMRQPSGSRRWLAGANSVIDFGAKPMATADNTGGKQWRTEALISMDQVHGTRIGSTTWLYKSVDSSVWLVEPNFNIFQGKFTVSLRRFGEFGAPPESYSYRVNAPSSVSNAMPRIDLIARYDVKKDGSGAIFCYALGENPVHWVEIRLSGPAQNCTIEMVQLYDEEQTTGQDQESNSDTGIGYKEVYMEASFVVSDTTNGGTQAGSYSRYAVAEVYRWPDDEFSYGGKSYMGRYSTNNSTYGRKDLIIGVCYSAGGGISPVKLTYGVSISIDGSGVLSSGVTGGSVSYSLIQDPDDPDRLITVGYTSNGPAILNCTIRNKYTSKWHMSISSASGTIQGNQSRVSGTDEFKVEYEFGQITSLAEPPTESFSGTANNSSGINTTAADSIGGSTEVTGYLAQYVAKTLSCGVFSILRVGMDGGNRTGAAWSSILTRDGVKSNQIQPSANSSTPWFSYNHTTGQQAHSYSEPVNWT